MMSIMTSKFCLLQDQVQWRVLHTHTKVKAKKHRLLFLPHIEEGGFQDRCDSYTDSGTQFCRSALLSLVCFSCTKQLLKFQSSHQHPRKQQERREKESLDLFSWILARGAIPHFCVLCIRRDLVSTQLAAKGERRANPSAAQPCVQFKIKVSTSKEKGGTMDIGANNNQPKGFSSKRHNPIFLGET